MKKRRTIVVGDIHGCLAEFKRLLQKVEYDKTLDRCIGVGDLLDRGPDSSGTVDFMMENEMEMVLGNHDEKYLKYWRNQKKDKRYAGTNPFRKNADKALVWDSLREEQFEWLNKQPYYIKVPEYNSFIVHAGIMPSKQIKKQDKDTFLYIRFVEAKTHRRLHLGPNFSQPRDSVHWSDLYLGTMDIVYGHTVHSITEPLVKINEKGGRTIGIDTGACFGGHLTALVYSEENPKGIFVQEKSEFCFKTYKLTI